MDIHRIYLSKADIEAIRASLGDQLRPDRIDLFGLVLQEWLARGFPEYAGLVPAKVSTRKRLEALSLAADKLLAALDALDKAGDAGLPAISLQDGGKNGHIRFAEAQNRVEEIRRDLESLSASALVWAQQYKKPSKQFAAPILAARDIALIFSWATGSGPTFFIDPYTGKMMGAFFVFAEAIWPHLEFKVPNPSLVEAIRKWSALPKDERLSDVIINMALRHPEWGPF
jgi:hypothetical protein